jgi:hypothetical protein
MIIAGKDYTTGTHGNISINNCSVTNLSGIFLTELQFFASPPSLLPIGCPANSASKLTVRGSVVAYNGVVLGRDLGNDNTTKPAVEFIYEPSLLFTLPTTFSVKNINWKETAPSW